MSKHRSSRITRAEAEQLLDTGAGGPEALAALMAAAVPPAAAGELVGEHAALMDFRAAHLANVAPRRRKKVMLKAAFANLLAAKVAAATAVAAAATGGVALAAATGNLPGPLQDTAHSAFGAPAATASTHSAQAAESDTTEATDTESAPSSTEPAESDSNAASGSASPSPNLMGLCKAYQAGATNNPGKAIDNPAFSVLVAAAGGKDNLDGFCTTLVGPAPTHTHGGPATHPSGAPTMPRGDGSTHASGHRHMPPTEHPAGDLPTELPAHP